MSESGPRQPLPPEILREFDLLTDLDAESLTHLAEAARQLVLDPGEYAFRPGEESDGVYLVREGAVVLAGEGENPGEVRLGAGTMFGEVGVLENSRRVASACSVERATLVRLPADDVRRLARDNRPFALKLLLVALDHGGAAPRAARAELGQRKHPRVQIGRPVVLRELPEGIAVSLENLSLGGACLTGAPPAWSPGELVAFGVEKDDGSELLRTRARVIWRSGSTVGLVFVDDSAKHRDQVRQALKSLM